MIIALRIVFALGLIVSLLYAAAFLRSGQKRHLRSAIVSLLFTLGLALVFFAGLFIERLTS